MAGGPNGTPPSPLPASLVFIERDWLSSNHLIGRDGERAVIVDTGYGSRAGLTVALVEHALGAARLERIINTHAHSDHVGGNAALKARHGCRIQVPAGAAEALRDNDDARLQYSAMGQACPPFMPDDTYGPGDRLAIGGLDWQVLGSPGHDNDSLVLWEPRHRLLMSGDALWENGFGLLFPVFYDEPAFEQQAATLDLIAARPVDLVLPGHGRLFGDAPAALARARQRLAYLRDNPERHGRLALKVALSFLLLDRRRMPLDRLATDFGELALVRRINDLYFGRSAAQLATSVRDELVAAGVARIEGAELVPDQGAAG